MFPPHSNLTLLIYDDTTIFCIYKIKFNRNKNNMKIGEKKWTNFHLMIYEKKMNRKGENIDISLPTLVYVPLIFTHVRARTIASGDWHSSSISNVHFKSGEIKSQNPLDSIKRKPLAVIYFALHYRINHLKLPTIHTNPQKQKQKKKEKCKSKNEYTELAFT